jgi:hypothetical protein
LAVSFLSCCFLSSFFEAGEKGSGRRRSRGYPPQLRRKKKKKKDAGGVQKPPKTVHQKYPKHERKGILCSA